jgi:hypothetical protein
MEAMSETARTDVLAQIDVISRRLDDLEARLARPAGAVSKSSYSREIPRRSGGGHEAGHPPLWQAARDLLKERINRYSFHVWFGDARLIKDDGDRLTISVSDEMCADWICQRYAAPLQEALAEAGRPDSSITIVVHGRP